MYCSAEDEFTIRVNSLSDVSLIESDEAGITSTKHLVLIFSKKSPEETFVSDLQKTMTKLLVRFRVQRMTIKPEKSSLKFSYAATAQLVRWAYGQGWMMDVTNNSVHISMWVIVFCFHGEHSNQMQCTVKHAIHFS